MSDTMADLQSEDVRLIRLVRAHQPVAGWCPVCRWPSGARVPSPCDPLLEGRLALEELVTADVAIEASSPSP